MTQLSSLVLPIVKTLGDEVREDTSRQVYRGRVYENEGLPALVDCVDSRQHRVLDVGCGAGANLRLLLVKGHDPVGLTLSEAEARVVRELGFTCVVQDISKDELPFPPASFDALLFSHVLEHVAWPTQVLQRYLNLLRPGGGVYVALPNALHLIQRIDFLRGRFRYSEMGTMDRTHLRFFDAMTARTLLVEAGLQVTRSFGVGQVPSGPLRLILPECAAWLDRLGSRLRPGLFAVHLIVVGKSISN